MFAEEQKVVLLARNYTTSCTWQGQAAGSHDVLVYFNTLSISHAASAARMLAEGEFPKCGLTPQHRLVNRLCRIEEGEGRWPATYRLSPGLSGPACHTAQRAVSRGSARHHVTTPASVSGPTAPYLVDT
ncbi:hypothetical protein J6590_055527 [Homalodisca vitripennis]|nr:hypothetical protein J6590_055527 [Homalodisca vitripennis]